MAQNQRLHLLDTTIPKIIIINIFSQTLCLQTPFHKFIDILTNTDAWQMGIKKPEMLSYDDTMLIIYTKQYCVIILSVKRLFVYCFS